MPSGRSRSLGFCSYNLESGLHCLVLPTRRKRGIHVALMAHTRGVVFLLSSLDILDIPLGVCGSQYSVLLLVRRRERIPISIAGKEFRACLSFFPRENYSRTLLKPLLRQEGSGVCWLFLCFNKIKSH